MKYLTNTIITLSVLISGFTLALPALAQSADCGLGSSGVPCDATNTGIAGKGLTTANLTTMSAGKTTSNGQLISRKLINVISA